MRSNVINLTTRRELGPRRRAEATRQPVRPTAPAADAVTLKPFDRKRIDEARARIWAFAQLGDAALGLDSADIADGLAELFRVIREDTDLIAAILSLAPGWEQPATTPDESGAA